MFRFSAGYLFSFLLALAVPAVSQDNEDTDGTVEVKNPSVLPVGLPVKLDISRRSLPNFLRDETALIPYRKGGESLSEFPGAFTIGSPEAQFAVIWAPSSCRIVGVLNLASDNADASYRLLASGVGPTASLAETSEIPKYFGMRIVEGRPEFLYTHGRHIISESVWLEDGGTILKQRFHLRKGVSSLKLMFPPDWIPFMESSEGEWDGGLLNVSGESVDEVTLRYRLSPATTEAGEEVAE